MNIAICLSHGADILNATCFIVVRRVLRKQFQSQRRFVSYLDETKSLSEQQVSKEGFSKNQTTLFADIQKVCFPSQLACSRVLIDTKSPYIYM